MYETSQRGLHAVVLPGLHHLFLPAPATAVLNVHELRRPQDSPRPESRIPPQALHGSIQRLATRSIRSTSRAENKPDTLILRLSGSIPFALRGFPRDSFAASLVAGLAFLSRPRRQAYRGEMAERVSDGCFTPRARPGIVPLLPP